MVLFCNGLLGIGKMPKNVEGGGSMRLLKLLLLLAVPLRTLTQELIRESEFKNVLLTEGDCTDGLSTDELQCAIFAHQYTGVHLDHIEWAEWHAGCVVVPATALFPASFWDHLTQQMRFSCFVDMSENIYVLRYVKIA